MRTTTQALLTELHAHSTWSDGELSLTELVDLYGRNGFDVLGVTDHVCRTDPLHLDPLHLDPRRRRRAPARGGARRPGRFRRRGHPAARGPLLRRDGLACPAAVWPTGNAESNGV